MGGLGGEFTPVLRRPSPRHGCRGGPGRTLRLSEREGGVREWHVADGNAACCTAPGRITSLMMRGSSGVLRAQRAARRTKERCAGCERSEQAASHSSALHKGTLSDRVQSSEQAAFGSVTCRRRAPLIPAPVPYNTSAERRNSEPFRPRQGASRRPGRGARYEHSGRAAAVVGKSRSKTQGVSEPQENVRGGGDEAAGRARIRPLGDD